MSDDLGQPFLVMKGISKAFPGVQALLDVDQEVYKGEIHGLVGKNGAGKSTLMAILMGLQQRDSGSLKIGGRSYETITPYEAIRAGVAYVPQHVSMIDSLTVAENVFVGEMPVGNLGFVDWRNIYDEAERRLQSLALKLDVYREVQGLSVTEQTLLAIAKALFGNAKLIILDEPTAALPKADVDLVFDFIRSLRDRGIAFIYISHHLEEVFEICDRVTVLRDGRLVGTRPVSELDQAELIRMMIGEDMSGFDRAGIQQDQIVLTIKGLVRRGHYEKIELIVRKGEVLGITGLQGCGAEALAAGLFGLMPRGLGTVILNNSPYTARNPKEAFMQGLAYLPQDRYLHGLVKLRPLRENVTYPILDRLLNLIGFVDRQRERTLVQEFVRELDIATPDIEQTVNLLSGGNQQKALFAKLAATRPATLLLHEPTQGIDVRAKLDIFRIIDKLSAQGVAIVIISAEVHELLDLCDRILVMREGQIIQEFKKDAPETTAENVLLAIGGGQ